MYSSICEEAKKQSGISQKELDEYIEIAKSAASIGAEVLMKYYGKINTIKTKSTETDLVTNADLEAENSIVSLLSKATPKIGIYAEEGGITGPETNLTDSTAKELAIFWTQSGEKAQSASDVKIISPTPSLSALKAQSKASMPVCSLPFLI